MNKALISFIAKITLTLFVSLQIISEVHLYLDEHDHSDEHQCVTCHINITSFVSRADLTSILISFVILLITKCRCLKETSQTNTIYLLIKTPRLKQNLSPKYDRWTPVKKEFSTRRLIYIFL